MEKREKAESFPSRVCSVYSPAFVQLNGGRLLSIFTSGGCARVFVCAPVERTLCCANEIAWGYSAGGVCRSGWFWQLKTSSREARLSDGTASLKHTHAHVCTHSRSCSQQEHTQTPTCSLHVAICGVNPLNDNRVFYTRSKRMCW